MCERVCACVCVQVKHKKLHYLNLRVFEENTNDLFAVFARRNARALYDCTAEDILELSFKKDDILYGSK